MIGLALRLMLEWLIVSRCLCRGAGLRLGYVGDSRLAYLDLDLDDVVIQ